jgi:amino acid transporter
MHLRNFFLGRPLPTEDDEHERVGPIVGVPILGLDALASAAYGPEALLTVLLPLGVAGLPHMTVLSALIVGLLVIVYVSYRQTIDAYPSGGGAYSVAKANLGTTASLLAAAALGLDYLLNVAVAISAGVGALVSAMPGLLPYTLPICLAVLVLLTLVNLRGVRASGFAFLVPTYAFIGTLLFVIGWGVFNTLTHGGHPEPMVAPPHPPVTAVAASTWLLMRAFANGCTAMTGVEAVSNGVPIFREPKEVGARRTLALIIAILVVLIAGEAILCRSYQVVAMPAGQPGYQSVLSILVAAVVGKGAFYYVTIGSVVGVLSLSANTSFADFPRLCRLLANDRFLPEPFVHRGRRLAFSHGILVLSALSAVLLVVFGGITDALIPLFAVGALLAFTMSQAGMVIHWRQRREEPGAYRHLYVNAVGCVATGLTLCVVIASKFTEGAWLSVLIVAAMLLVFRQVRRHYDFIARATSTEASLWVGPVTPPVAVVPIRRWDAVALKALRLALTIASDVVAVQVLTGDRECDDLTGRWDELADKPSRELGIAPPRLVVLRSQFRDLYGPLLDYVNQRAGELPDQQVAVMVPQLVEARWYHALLHNHAASFLKTRLLQRGNPQVVVINVPWYLRDWLPERELAFHPARSLRRRLLDRYHLGTRS